MTSKPRAFLDANMALACIMLLLTTYALRTPPPLLPIMVAWRTKKAFLRKRLELVWGSAHGINMRWDGSNAT
jgi:hypothetical protein